MGIFIIKDKFCINKKAILIIIGISLLVIVSLFKKQISFKAKAEVQLNNSICGIDLQTMKTTSDCCNEPDKLNGYRCYINNYSIDCKTRNVIKCKCDNISGKCSENITPTNQILKTPTPTPVSKPSLCDLYGKYATPDRWQKLCCSQSDIDTGRFKCIKTESESGFIKTPVYNQFHCSAQRYWKCEGGCSEYNGEIYPTCKKISSGPYIVITPTTTILNPTKTPTPKPTFKVSQSPKPVTPTAVTVQSLPPAKVNMEFLGGSIYNFTIIEDNGPVYGINTYVFRIDLNPDMSTCRTYVSLDEFYKYGLVVRSATIKAYHEASNLVIKVYDTHNGSLEVFSKTLPYSDFWSIYGDYISVTYCVE
ncbi:MAG: hypothetical protein UR68_C0012G0006 [Candidatus Roizmanbacteria bacterium GW2011_GWA2_35_19]|uniref:Uncharacterized protein n=2 Tax=Candidatus Roizmaniibacteriota TaxID=1752723 RepID=A0A0G0BU46_9BACT|nr:MAG: hypothetical protein UR63_C0031G0006 [Candidatus Roizmanbacteria bacterium GW2011_GWC2_35_12]KKP72813.1 MAG: hypothetical protein UR68_C0012G0006 [Candidatus Roizmanbacteria bacterium GW2011_GWA2_35_19]